jgi:hypothetical protein
MLLMHVSCRTRSLASETLFVGLAGIQEARDEMLLKEARGASKQACHFWCTFRCHHLPSATGVIVHLRASVTL